MPRLMEPAGEEMKEVFCGSYTTFVITSGFNHFLGTFGFAKVDVFLENFRRGGGVISDPKKYIADFFGFKTVYFGRKFWKKCPKRGEGRGGSSPIQKISLQIYAS